VFPGVALVVLDGWGLAEAGPGNAVSLAATPVFDGLWARYPHTQLTACGLAVGLPEGQMGNSEVGHLNLGAGSVVRQDLTRIDAAVAASPVGELWTVSVHGADHPGIVHGMAVALADLKVNVVDLATRVVPGDDGAAYVMVIDVTLPDGVDRDDFLALLHEVGARLGVICSAHAADVDIL